METWVESFVKDMVSAPEAVSVSLSQGMKTRIMDITVAGDDMAVFKSQQSRLLKALNTVAGLAGAKDRIRYVLKVSG